MVNQLEKLLAISALILSIVNAIFLLRQYLRDKPKLKLRVIDSQYYQWWFEHPSNTNQEGKRIGFLLYFEISNSGLRATTIEDWNLLIRRKNGKKIILHPIGIPQPTLKINLPSGSVYSKVYKAIGMATESNSNPSHIPPGNSISGWAYYLLDGIDEYSSLVKHNKIPVEIVVTDVFDTRVKQKILTNEISYEYAKIYVPNLDEIGQLSINTPSRQIQD